MSTTTNHSAFKQAQTRYRRRPHEPDHVDDLDEAVDFSQFDAARMVRLVRPGGTSWYQGPIYGLEAYPGLVYAPDALSPHLSHYLAHAAVTQYCEAPHRTNLNGVAPKPHEHVTDTSLWEHYKEAERQQQHAATNPPDTTSVPYRSFRKLTWSTLGYHYDWTARAYHKHVHSPMPDVLDRLGRLFARTAAASHESTSTRLEHATATVVPYKVTAAIVNYYTSKSVMGGHRDDLEEAVTQPIVSLSLGRPALFVLGGATLDSVPVVAIVVRPGDVMMLSGACRLNYHSMARLLPAAAAALHPTTQRTPRSMQVQLEDVMEHDEQRDYLNVWNNEAELVPLNAFLAQHRININLRQVYHSDA